MKNSGRLIFSFALSFLIHLGVVAYMNQKTLEPFGAHPAEARERPIRVGITRELPRSVTKPLEEMDHLIREERIQKLFEERSELPLENPPEPDSEKPSSVPGARRYRTRGHHVHIGLNGAIAFENIKSQMIEFSKPGADGQEVKK